MYIFCIYCIYCIMYIFAFPYKLLYDKHKFFKHNFLFTILYLRMISAL